MNNYIHMKLMDVITHPLSGLSKEAGHQQQSTA